MTHVLGVLGMLGTDVHSEASGRWPGISGMPAWRSATPDGAIRRTDWLLPTAAEDTDIVGLGFGTARLDHRGDSDPTSRAPQTGPGERDATGPAGEVHPAACPILSIEAPSCSSLSMGKNPLNWESLTPLQS